MSGQLKARPPAVVVAAVGSRGAGRVGRVVAPVWDHDGLGRPQGVARARQGHRDGRRRRTQGWGERMGRGDGGVWLGRAKDASQLVGQGGHYRLK